MQAVSRFETLMDFVRSCADGFLDRENIGEAIQWRSLLREFSENNLKKEYPATYQEYLQSPRWKELKAQALRRANYLCQICASPQFLEVHHRRYPKVFGMEAIEDLTVLCRRCHKHWHEE